MDIIQTYLENIFRALPRTPELLKIKGQLRESMEMKCHELLGSGISEGEAVAQVIGDFGNIDELLDELGIAPSQIESTASIHRTDDYPEINSREVTDFFSRTKVAAWLINAAVAIMATGAILLVIWSRAVIVLFAGEAAAFLSVLFVLSIVAAILFSRAAIARKDLAFIENGEFVIGPLLLDRTEQEYKAKKLSMRNRSIIGAFSYLIMTAVLVFASLMDQSFSLLCILVFLLLTAAGTIIAIRSQMIFSAYQMLLKISNRNSDDRSISYVIGASASIIWPSSIALYLMWAIGYGWEIAWIFLPVVGGLFIAFAVLYPHMRGNKSAI